MFGVTPVTSAILSEVQVHRDIPQEFRQAVTIPAAAQRDRLTTVFSYIAYSHRYLNGSLPRFTTTEYAVLPFQPAKNEVLRPVEQWTGQSTLYEGHLSCTAGTVRFDASKNSTIVSSNTGNCTYELHPWDYIDLGDYAPYTSFFIDKTTLTRRDPGTIIGAYGPDCEIENVLVGFFGKNTGQLVPGEKMSSRTNPMLFGNASAIFCQPVHEQQPVTVTVDARTGEIRELSRQQQQQGGSAKSGFDGVDLDNWGGLLTSRVASASTADFNVSTDASKSGLEVGFQQSTLRWGLPDHFVRLKLNPAFSTGMENYKVPKSEIEGRITPFRPTPINTFIVNPRSITPFGLTLQHNLDDLLDPTKLMQMYNSTYKMLFSFAMGSGLAEFGDGGNSSNSTLPIIQGQRKFIRSGFVMDPTWSRVLQGLFSAVLAFDLLFIALMWTRKCNIAGDPGTLASVMSRLDVSTLEDFQDASFLRPKQLAAMLKAQGHRYVLQDQRVVRCSSMDSGDVGASTVMPPLQIDRTKSMLYKPWDFTAAVGISSTLLLVGCIAVLGVLYSRNRSQNGFRALDDGVVYDIYASYLPTLLATLAESFLTILGGYIALFSPFKMLGRGNAKAEQTLTVNYDRAPPHLHVLYAFRTKNALLASVSFSILMANVLTIALGGLFYKASVQLQRTGEVVLLGSMQDVSAYNATIKDGLDIDFESFYAAAGDDLSFERRPWTTDDLYYIPFTDPDQAGQNRTNYTALSLGLGANINCEVISGDGLTDWIVVSQSAGAVAGPTGPPAKNYTVTVLSMAEEPAAVLSPLAQGGGNTLPLSARSMTLLDSIIPPDAILNPGLLRDKYGLQYNSAAPIRFVGDLARKYGPLSFSAGWNRYAFGSRRVVVNNPNKTIGLWEGETVDGPSAYVSTHSYLRCAASPRMVSSRVQVRTSTSGTVINATNYADELPLADDKPGGFGIRGLLSAFHEMMFRTTASEVLVGSRLANDSRPANWLEFLVYQQARRSNPLFDIYSDAEETARSMETVYKRVFATYLQLRSADFFPRLKPAVAAAAAAAAGGGNDAQTAPVPSTFLATEVRILMRPFSFYLSISLLALFVPVVGATYIMFYDSFLPHSPAALAGIYAAVYASRRALADVAGTELIDDKERRSRLKKLGARYGYGWFATADGERHLGIEKEPLMGVPVI